MEISRKDDAPREEDIYTPPAEFPWVSVVVPRLLAQPESCLLSDICQREHLPTISSSRGGTPILWHLAEKQETWPLAEKLETTTMFMAVHLPHPNPRNKHPLETTDSPLVLLCPQKRRPLQWLLVLVCHVSISKLAGHLPHPIQAVMLRIDKHRSGRIVESHETSPKTKGHEVYLYQGSVHFLMSAIPLTLASHRIQAAISKTWPASDVLRMASLQDGAVSIKNTRIDFVDLFRDSQKTPLIIHGQGLEILCNITLSTGLPEIAT